MKTFKVPSLRPLVCSITFILLASSAVSVTQGTALTNWVGTSTRGLKNGTQANPFDGSTQAKFDAVMRAVPRDSTLIILPGTYQTKGTGFTNRNYQLPSGVHVYGSGMDVTTIKLAATAESGCYVMGFDVGTNELVQDITLDCNYKPTMGKVTLSGLCFTGTQCTARRVKAVNMVYYDTNVNSESWGITLVPGATDSTLQSTNNLYEQCVVSPYQTNTGTALAFNGASVPPNSSGSSASGIMRSNRIFNAYAAMNGGWTHDWLIQGNYVQGGIAGLYGDTGTYTNVTLLNNTFTNTLRPIYLHTALRDGLTVASNTIYLPAQGSMLVCDPSSAGQYNYNFALFSNTISRSDPSANVFLDIYDLDGLAVMNNWIDTNLGVTLRFCSKVAICGNHDLKGIPYTRFDQGCPTLTPPGNFRMAPSNLFAPQ